eukprot:528207-Hanusia_phi.AAC.1
MSSDMQGMFVNAADQLSIKRAAQAQVFEKMRSCILTCATFSDRVNDFKLGTIKQEVTAVIEMKQEGALPTAKAFFEKMENDIDINEYIQTVVDNELLAQYEELDMIISSVEKRGRDTLSGKVFLAKEFNRCLMNLNRVEEMWFALVDAFQTALGPADGNSLASYLWADFDQFSQVLEALQLDVNTARKRELFFSSIDAEQDTSQSDRFISPTSLLCESQMFRDIMCQEADEDALKLSSLFKSNILRVMSFSHLQYISWRSKRVILKEGQKLTCKEPCMFLVNKGRLRVMLHNDASDICLKLEYGSDTLFGEVWLLTGFAPILMVRAVQRTELIQVHKSDIAAILQVSAQRRKEWEGEGWEEQQQVERQVEEGLNQCAGEDAACDRVRQRADQGLRVRPVREGDPDGVHRQGGSGSGLARGFQGRAPVGDGAAREGLHGDHPQALRGRHGRQHQAALARVRHLARPRKDVEQADPQLHVGDEPEESDRAGDQNHREVVGDLQRRAQRGPLQRSLCHPRVSRR